MLFVQTVCVNSLGVPAGLAAQLFIWRMLTWSLVFDLPFTSFHSQILSHVFHCIHNWDDSVLQEGSHGMQIKLHANEMKSLNRSHLRCDCLSSKWNQELWLFFFHHGSSHYQFCIALWSMNRWDITLNLSFCLFVFKHSDFFHQHKQKSSVFTWLKY